MEIYLLLTKVSSIIPDENFFQNFSYNFSEFLYNFYIFLTFFIRIGTVMSKLCKHEVERVNATEIELLDRV